MIHYVQQKQIGSLEFRLIYTCWFNISITVKHLSHDSDGGGKLTFHDLFLPAGIEANTHVGHHCEHLLDDSDGGKLTFLTPLPS